jgi:DNA-binding Lrp family transcriptional regulator
MIGKNRYKPDEVDIRILAMMQEDCNVSIRKLSSKIGIPSSTVQRRMVNLQKRGIIRACRAVLDKEYLGYITIFSLVKVATGFVKDEGGYIENFAEDMVRESYEVEPGRFFVVDRKRKVKANPWEFVLDVFSSLGPRTYGEDIAAIQIIYALHGRYDILVKVTGTDQRICGKYIEDSLAIIPGITGIESFTVFDVKKDDDRVPFAMEK